MASPQLIYLTSSSEKREKAKAEWGGGSEGGGGTAEACEKWKLTPGQGAIGWPVD